jgi:hypothetical protein
MKVTKTPANLTPESNTAKQREAIDNGHKPGTESEASPVGTIAPLLWARQQDADSASPTNKHSEEMTTDAANNAYGPGSDTSTGPHATVEALLRDKWTGNNNNNNTLPPNQPAKNTINSVLPRNESK